MWEAFDLSFRLCNQSCHLVLSLNRKSVWLCLTWRNRHFFVAAWTPASHELKRGERQHKDRTEKSHRGSFTPHIQMFKVPFVLRCSKTSGVYMSGYDRSKSPLKESHTCWRVAAPIYETSTPSINTHSPGLPWPRRVAVKGKCWRSVTLQKLTTAPRCSAKERKKKSMVNTMEFYSLKVVFQLTLN